MDTYFNMDRKLIRHGGRKAPKAELHQFLDILGAGLPPIPDYVKNLDGGYYLDGLSQEDYFEKRFCEEPDIITTNGLGKVGSDLRGLAGLGLEISFEKFGVADNGVPYLFLSAYEDCGQPFAIILYCDGETIRGYLPRYGNMISIPEHMPFSDISETEMYKRPVYVQDDGGPVEKLSFSSEEELYDYIVNSDGYLTYSQEACMEDFCARVEATGEITPEMVEAAQKNVANTLKRYMNRDF